MWIVQVTCRVSRLLVDELLQFLDTTGQVIRLFGCNYLPNSWQKCIHVWSKLRKIVQFNQEQRVLEEFFDVTYVMFVVRQISLREGCRKILVADCYQLLQKLVRIQKKGIYVDGKLKKSFISICIYCYYIFVHLKLYS